MRVLSAYVKLTLQPSALLSIPVVSVFAALSWQLLLVRAMAAPTAPTEISMAKTRTMATATTTTAKVTPVYINWWLSGFDEEYKKRLNAVKKFYWASATNVTDANQKAYNDANAAYLSWMTNQRKQVSLQPKEVLKCFYLNFKVQDNKAEYSA